MKDDSCVSAAAAWEMAQRRPIQKQSLELWKKSKQPGAIGKAARDRLCYIYRPLVEAVVLRSFAKWGSSHFDDFVQEGYVALLEAIDSYNPDKGTILTSYCWTRVEWQLKAARPRLMNAISFSVRDEKLRRKGFAVQLRLTTELGRSPSTEEIALECDAPVRKLAALMSVSSASADAVWEGSTISLLDRLSDPGLSPEEALEEEQEAGYLAILLSRLKPEHQGRRS